MLTDYHLHLRPDELAATPEQYFTPANVERYREAAAERGIAELGVSEHVYRFRQALEIWKHPFWVEYAHDDLDAYCRFVRERRRPAARDRGRLRAGRRGPHREPAGSARTSTTSSARFTSFATRPSTWTQYGVWGNEHSAEEIWRRYFETLGEAARSGLFDILAHPDLVKVWGKDRPLPDGDLRRYYEPAIEAIAESGIAVEVSTAGLRKRVRELYPAPAFLEMCLEAGAPIALSSDAHRPQDVGADYDQALELLARARRRASCACSSGARGGWSRSARGAMTAAAGADGGDRPMTLTGIGYDCHRLAAGRR